ncbi:hypothetical protein G9A89_021366 [Geosiphon pyriformis]|nr:hypothetical protein G9A89_021366 [Geosiphon pyriformis]
MTDNSGTHTIIRPKKTTTRRERIGSKMNKYLLESITAAILVSSTTIEKMIKEILPIDKNLSYGRQLELYGRLSEIIEDMKLMKKTTSEIQVKILGIIWLDVPRVLTIARRAKTLIQRFGLLDTKLISPQVLYTLSTKDFNKQVSFELDKTLQLEYPINSLILSELNLFEEDDVMIKTHNGSMVKAGSKNTKEEAAFITHRIEAKFGIAVDRTLLSTKTEAKTVLLALEAVSYKCKLMINTDSQVVMSMAQNEKKIDLNINKVAAHTDVLENEKTDKLAKVSTILDTESGNQPTLLGMLSEYPREQNTD